MQCDYKTLDLSNADYIVKGYSWRNIPKFGCIISGQTLEHDPFFWRTLKNMSKHADAVIIIVPSKGNYHAFPVDCYRFLKDADDAFAKIMNMQLMETVLNPGGDWGDLGMVFKKK